MVCACKVIPYVVFELSWVHHGFASVLEKTEKTISSGVPLNEMATKMAAVLPILCELGWDDLNPNEVAPELSVPPDGFVDFALCDVQENPPRPLVFIEAKRVGRFARSTVEPGCRYNVRIRCQSRRSTRAIAFERFWYCHTGFRRYPVTEVGCFLANIEANIEPITAMDSGFRRSYDVAIS